jgi:hypothetical protein
MRVRHSWLVSVLGVLIVLVSIGGLSPSVAFAKASHPSHPSLPLYTFNSATWYRDGFYILVDLWGYYPEPGIGTSDETDGNLRNCNAYPENGNQNAGYTRDIYSGYSGRLANSGFTGDITYPANCQYYFATNLIYQPPQNRPVWGCLDSYLNDNYSAYNLCQYFS